MSNTLKVYFEQNKANLCFEFVLCRVGSISFRLIVRFGMYSQRLCVMLSSLKGLSRDMELLLELASSIDQHPNNSNEHHDRSGKDFNRGIEKNGG